MSARLRAASISTRKPSRVTRRGSVNGVFMLEGLPYGNIAAFGLILACNELSSKELAYRRFWNVLNEHVSARPLEIGKARTAAELIELIRCNGPRPLDKRTDDRAPALI